MVYEVRPPVKVDKGTAVMSLAGVLGGLEEGASLVFIGDDRSDEDAFQLLRSRLPRAVTIRVAEDEAEVKATAAEFVVPNTAAVRDFLEELESLLAEEDGTVSPTSPG